MGQDASRLEERLREAAAEGDLAAVKELLVHHGVSVNCGHAYNLASLHEFVFDDPKDRAEKLAWTPLHWAAKGGHEAVVELLLDHGADVEAVDTDGNTALHVAAMHGEAKCCQLLLDFGSDVDARTACDRGTPIHFAAIKGKLPAVKVLVAAGANVTAKTLFHKTPLQYAVMKHHSAVAEYLESVEASILKQAHEAASEGSRREHERVRSSSSRGAAVRSPSDVALKMPSTRGSAKRVHDAPADVAAADDGSVAIARRGLALLHGIDDGGAYEKLQNES